LIFLCDIETDGNGCYHIIRESNNKDNKIQKISKKVNKKNKRMTTKIVRLANKLAGFSKCSQGEIEVIKSYASTLNTTNIDNKNKVVNNTKGYQKKINYKRQVK